MQVNASVVQIATTIMDALIALVADAPACKTMQRRIAKDPPDSWQIRHHRDPAHRGNNPDSCIPIQSNSPFPDKDTHSHQLEPPQSLDVIPTFSPTPHQDNQQLSQCAAHPATSPPFQSNPLQQRFFLDRWAGLSAPLAVAAKAANLAHFSPFDIEFNHLCNILDDSQFENLLQLAHLGLIGAIWSAPPCKLYSQLRQEDGWAPIPDTSAATPSKYRNPKKSTADHLFYVQQYFNEEVLQPKNNPSILLHGANHFTSNSSHNAHVFLSQHQPANGDLIGTKPRLLQLHPAESQHCQDIVHVTIILTFEEKGSPTDPLSAH